MSESPAPVKVTLFGKIIFANILKYLEIMRVSWITQMDPKSNANCPDKREAEGNRTDRSKGVNVKTEAEIGVMWPQAKEC